MVLPVLSMALATPAQALDDEDLWGDQKDEVQTALGYDSDPKDPREIAAEVINVLLGFLGIIAVVLIIWGGFKWMTAGGNDDQVSEARKIITTSFIGLIIILAAWGIASFVLGAIGTAVDG